MTWSELLETGAVRPHETSADELNDLRGVIERDLSDAAVSGISNDRKFATAYSAALQTAKMAIACAGYRTAGPGAHAVAYQAAAVALGRESEEMVRFFEVCRRKRNRIEYDRSGSTTAAEAEEVLGEARSFYGFVLRWIEEDFPSLRS